MRSLLSPRGDLAGFAGRAPRKMVTVQDSPGIKHSKAAKRKRPPVWRDIKATLHGPGSIATIFFAYTEFKIGRQMDPSASLLSWSILFAPASGSGLTHPPTVLADDVYALKVLVAEVEVAVSLREALLFVKVLVR